MAADSNPDAQNEIETGAAVPGGKQEPTMDAKPEPKFEAKPDAGAKPQDSAQPQESAKPDQSTKMDKGAEAGAKSDGKALATSGVSPVNPFLGIAPEDAVEGGVVPPRSFASRLLDYSAHAAIIIGLIGFAWTVSDHIVSKPVAKNDAPAAAVAETTPAAPAKLDEMGELRLANLKMHDEIKSLKASVDALRTAARHDTTPEQVRMLAAGLETVKGNIASTKTDTRDAIAQIQGKVDKLQPSKVQALSDRVGRLEHQTIDTASTGSIPRHETAKAEAAESTRAAPTPPSKPSSLAAAEEKAADEAKPQIISGWVVRDVYEGVALIEGKRGTLEVVPGVAIPGAGVVKSIDRKGGVWTVTTSKGQVAYAGNAPHNDYRRGPYQRGPGYGGPGGYGGGYRYDY